MNALGISSVSIVAYTFLRPQCLRQTHHVTAVEATMTQANMPTATPMAKEASILSILSCLSSWCVTTTEGNCGRLGGNGGG